MLEFLSQGNRIEGFDRERRGANVDLYKLGGPVSVMIERIGALSNSVEVV